MNQKLTTKTEEWKGLRRDTDQLRAEADDFYDRELMPLIEENFLANNHADFEENQYLIFSVGTSYEPLVLNIRLMKPQRILFLYTNSSERIVDKVVGYCGLDAMSYEKKRVGDKSSLEIYMAIKEAYVAWGQPEKIYLDITGGTKVMSSAAAMSGAILKMQLIYVSSEYLPDLKKPRPGSEKMVLISNPMEVFGDLEKEKAYALFDQFNYAGAAKELEELKESVPNSQIRQELTYAYDLAKTYEYWDTLEFSSAYISIKRLTRDIRRDIVANADFLMADFIDQLNEQENILQKLSEMTDLIQKKCFMEILKNQDYIIPLMFTMYINADIRSRQSKYDMATLLLYRLLEMIEQRRLASYNLYVSDTNYPDIQYRMDRLPRLESMDSEQRLEYLKTRVSEILGKLFGNADGRELPDKISLLDGYIILLALNDEIFPDNEKRAFGRLNQIRSKVALRNNSIFAHGLGPISASDFGKFRELVEELFREFCKAESIDFDDYKRKMEWLSPTRSKYYKSAE